MKIIRSFALFLAFITGFAVSSSFVRAEEVAKAPTPVAKIGNTVLTEDELRKDMGMNLYEAENQLYQVKKNWVDQKVKNMLFDQTAKEAGLSRQAWEAR